MPANRNRPTQTCMARQLLRMASVGDSSASVRAVVRSVPHLEEEPDPASSFCAFLLCSIRTATLSDRQYRRYERLARYWLDEFPAEYQSQR